METVFTAVSDIISTGRGDWAKRGRREEVEREGGGATEMHPDWLGLRHGSLRPLWSSATSFCSEGPYGPEVPPGAP